MAFAAGLVTLALVPGSAQGGITPAIDGSMTGRSKTFDGPNNFGDNKGLRVLLAGEGDTGGNRTPFALSCDPAATDGDLEVRWGFQAKPEANRFNLTGVDSVSCFDVPGQDSGTPEADFEALHLTGTGIHNGQPAEITLRVTDYGEAAGPHPGRRLDRTEMTIRDATTDALILQMNRFIGEGNHQAAGSGTGGGTGEV
jgi:hypothetical protein